MTTSLHFVSRCVNTKNRNHYILFRCRHIHMQTCRHNMTTSLHFVVMSSHVEAKKQTSLHFVTMSSHADTKTDIITFCHDVVTSTCKHRTQNDDIITFCRVYSVIVCVRVRPWVCVCVCSFVHLFVCLSCVFVVFVRSFVRSFVSCSSVRSFVLFVDSFVCFVRWFVVGVH